MDGTSRVVLASIWRLVEILMEILNTLNRISIVHGKWRVSYLRTRAPGFAKPKACYYPRHNQRGIEIIRIRILRSNVSYEQYVQGIRLRNISRSIWRS